MAKKSSPGDDCMSLALVSKGQYGVPEGLVFSYPVRSDGQSWSVVEGLRHGPAARAALKATADELITESDGVRDLVPR